MQGWKRAVIFGSLGAGALLYFIPYLFGVQALGVDTGAFATISNFMVTSSNPLWAVGLAYVSIALLAIMGAAAVVYTLRTGGRAEMADPEEVAAPQP